MDLIWISKILVIVYLSSQIDAAFSNPKCVFGDSNTCYWFVNTLLRRSPAKSTCETDGGVLVTIESAAVDALLKAESLTTDFWIALGDQETESVFRWTYGRVMMYTNFANPLDILTEHHCVYWNVTNYMWETASCTESKAYVCQSPAPTCDSVTDKQCLGYQAAANLKNGWPLCYKLANSCPEDELWKIYSAEDYANASTHLTNSVVFDLTEEKPGLWVRSDGTYPEGGVGTWIDTSTSITNSKCASTTSSQKMAKIDCGHSTLNKLCAAPLASKCAGPSVLGATLTVVKVSDFQYQYKYACDSGSVFADNTIFKTLTCDCNNDDSQVYALNLKCFPASDVCQIADNCVTTFEYLGSTYNGCSNKNFNRYWCSHEAVYVYSSNKYSHCNCDTASSRICDTEVFAHSGSCYWMELNNQETWPNALEKCQTNGGTLAVIQDQQTFELITNSSRYAAVPVGTFLSIGMSSGNSLGVFRWINTQPITWTKWRDSEPNNRNSISTAGYLSKDTKSLINFLDTDPASSTGYICQSKTDLYCNDTSIGCFPEYEWTTTADKCYTGTTSVTVQVSMNMTTGEVSLPECQKHCRERVDFVCTTVFVAPLIDCNNIIYGSCTLLDPTTAADNTKFDTSCIGGQVSSQNEIVTASQHGICYDDIKAEANFTHFVDTCNTLYSGYLALPKTTNDVTSIAAYMTTSSISSAYIGIYFKDPTTRIFAYADGTYPTFIDWATNEPKKPVIQSCVKLDSSTKKMSTVDCSVVTSEVAICQAPMASYCAGLPNAVTYPEGSIAYDADANKFNITCTPMKAAFSSGETMKQFGTCTCNAKSELEGEANTSPCIAGTCGTPTLPNADINNPNNSTLWQDTVNYTCQVGYEFAFSNDSQVTELTATCQTNSKWHYPLACIPLNCGLPEPSANMTIAEIELGATILCTSTIGPYAVVVTYGATLTLSCDAGYWFSPAVTELTTTCTANATWDPMPNCTLVTCGPPPNFNDSSITTPPSNGNNYLSTLAYSCDHGYRTTDFLQNKTSKCEADGTWTVKDTDGPICILIDCGNATVVNPSVVIPAASYSTLYQSEITYTCAVGYYLNGSLEKNATCAFTSEWIFTESCTPLSCGIPSPLINTTIAEMDLAATLTNDTLDMCTYVIGLYQPPTTYESILTFKCSDGYWFSKDVFEYKGQCHANATWYWPPCEPLTCGPHPNISNANNSDTFEQGIGFGVSVNYTCAYGYKTVHNELNFTSECPANGNWSVTEENNPCIAVNCGPLTNPHDPYREIITINYTTILDSTADYICQTGYHLNGSFEDTATCGFDDKWMVPTNCTIVDCGPPDSLMNATIVEPPPDPSNNQSGILTTYNSTVYLKCDPGFWITPAVLEQPIKCLANISWEIPKPCVPVNCGMYPNISNADVTILPDKGYEYQSSLTYTCHPGYRTVNKTLTVVSECLMDGNWSILETDEPCLEILCDNNEYPPPPNTAITFGNSSAVGSNDSTVDCITQNYWFNDTTKTKMVTCVLNSDLLAASYEGFPFDGCALVECADPTTTGNATMIFTETRVENTTSHQCLPGFHFDDWIPTQTTTCNSSGLWTELDHICILTDCKSPPSLTSADVSLTLGHTLENGTAEYTCQPGFDHFNPNASELVCQKNGKWSSFETLCVIRDCGPLPNTTVFATPIFTRTKVHDTAQYHCDIGYTSNFNSPIVVVTCPLSGVWKVNGIYCEPVQCGIPAPMSNGEMVYNYTGYRAETVYTCNPGYEFSNEPNAVNLTSNCRPNQKWTSIGSFCRAKNCGIPSPINNTELYYTNTTYLYTVVYVPKTGYTFSTATSSPQMAITCREGGSWEVPTFSMIYVNCGQPPYVVNAIVNSTGTSFGSISTYICPPDTYFTDLMGSRNVTCQANGIWEPQSNAYCRYNLSGPIILPAGAGYFGGPLGAATYNFFMLKSLSYGPNTPIVDLATISGTFNLSVSREPLYRSCDTYVPSNAVVHNLNDYYPIEFGYSTYDCLYGYEFDDETTRRSYICLPDNFNGQTVWHYSEREGGCKRKYCPIREQYPGTYCNTYEHVTGTVVICSCNDTGMVFKNGQTEVKIECLEEKQWSYEPLYCASRCDILPLIDNARAAIDYDTAVGSQVLVSCIIGHRFPDGSKKRYLQCLPTRQWNNIDKCYDDVCPFVEPPTNGHVNTSNAVYGTYVAVECNPGFTFTRGNYSIVILCDVDAVWNATYTNCTDINCDAPPTVANAVQTGNSTTYNSQVSYKCTDGHGIAANPKDTYRTEQGQTGVDIVCQQNSEWTDPQVSCELGRCYPVPTVTNAVADSSNSSDGSVVTYTCLIGHRFANNMKTHTIKCSNIEWNITEYSCQELNCPTAPNISHAVANETSTSYLSYIGYECATGYSFEDRTSNNTGTVKCNEEGVWELMEPIDMANIPNSCSLLHCGPGPNVYHAKSASTGLDTYGTEVTYRCSNGYWFSRGVYARSVMCTANELWEPEIPRTCSEIKCPALPYWDGLVINNTASNIGIVVNVSCGVNKDGDEQIFSDRSTIKESVCSKQGDWIPAIPECVEKVPDPPFQPEPQEAENAETFGALGIGMFTFTIVAALIMDIPTYFMAARRVIGDLNNLRQLLSKSNNVLPHQPAQSAPPAEAVNADAPPNNNDNQSRLSLQSESLNSFDSDISDDSDSIFMSDFDDDVGVPPK